MQNYEFTVLPAPRRVQKFGGVRKDESYSAALTEIMNEMGKAGWDFAGAECLPARIGRWPFSRMSERHVLVFRRAKEARTAQTQGREAAMRQEAPIEITVQPRRVSTQEGPRKVRKLRPQLAPHSVAAE